MLKRILVIILLSCMSFAQTNATAQGGALSSVFGNKALLSSSLVTFYNAGTVIPATGYVTIQTPILASGNLTDGGTFAAGGAFVVSVTSVPQTFNGAFVSGAWTKQTLANGTHAYVMTGTTIDVVTGETGAFTLQTANIGTGNFDTVISIINVSIVMN